uniref:Peptidase M13 C-terminal domain-containing protein n=1 Tax=Tetranychus urticae TaxID=32264 RepID=T1KX15_TETUR
MSMPDSERKTRRFSSLRFANGKVTNRPVSLNENNLNEKTFIVIDGPSITLSDQPTEQLDGQVFLSSTSADKKNQKEMNYMKESSSHPGSPPVITVRESSSTTVNEKDDISLYGTPKEEMAPGFGEAKASFMRHQIEALFQPSDNKLAMKLFGSKKLMKERLRQKESGHWIIHPCSNFRYVNLSLSNGSDCQMLFKLLIVSHKQSNYVTQMKNLCLTPGCVKAASSILSRLDVTVDPCHDFYSFACGSFVKMRTVPDHLSTYDMLQQMEEVSTIEMRKFFESNISSSDGIAIGKAKIFYASCIDDKSSNNDTEIVSALIETIVHSTGPWPLLDSLIYNRSPSEIKPPPLEERILDTFIYQVQSLFRITILPEILPNATRNDLCLSIGRTVIEDEYLVNPNKTAKYDEYKALYKEYHIKMMEKLASLLVGDEIKLSAEHISEIDAVIDFEMEFGKLTAQDFAESNNNDTSNINNNVNSPVNNNVNNSESRPPRPLISINDFANNFTSIQWQLIFGKLSSISGVNISDLCMEKEEYLVKMNELIPKYSLRTIDNYICWSILAQFIDYLGPSFRRLQVEFRRRVPEIRVTEQNRIFFSRWKECVYITTRILPIPSSHLYLAHKPDHVTSAAIRVNLMLKEIKDAMYHIIDSQEWLDESNSEPNSNNVRTILKKRIADSSLLVGLPDYLLDRQTLDEQYKDLHLSMDQVFINNWLNLTRHEKILELSRIGLTAEKNPFYNSPTEANAFYDWNIKMITFPLGILHEPIISEGRPKFLDYSTLGHILGHEIGHSLDREPDTDNTTGINWWPYELKTEYERRARCFADQYSTYKIDLINEFVNGNNTLTENICDFVGLQQAYLAWSRSTIDQKTQLPGLTNYSSDQLFFLQYGQVFCEVATPDGYLKNLLTDPHSPGKFRANGVLVNTPQFAKAFNCPLGTPMNPVGKCKLWSLE